MAQSLLSETHLGSRCYRVHAPILAFAKTLLLLQDSPYRRGVAEEETEEAKDEEEKEETETAAAMGTREAAVASQARYLSRVDVLLRFSGGGGGGGGGAGGSDAAQKVEQVARRCGEKLLLGGLPTLATLWQSLEDKSSVATAPPLLQDAYRAALQDLGECVKAASGYWGAAKLLQLQVLF